MLDKELIGELHNIQNIIVQAHNGKIKELHLIVKELREIIDLIGAIIKIQGWY